MCLKTSQHAWTPVNTNGRIRESHRATPTSHRSSPVNDAGALAPVVFSGQPEIKTGKIRKIKSSKVPYPPKSSIPDSMVVSVSIENASNYQFEAPQFENPK